MSSIFDVGDSYARGSPPLSPQCRKSKVKATNAASVNRLAYTAGICSFTVVHDPVTMMVGHRCFDRSGRWRLPTIVSLPL
jgi:hypothetical protein